MSTNWPALEPTSDAWAEALSAAAAPAAERGDATTLVQLSAELRRYGLADPSTKTLQAWTGMLTPLLYVAKRRDIADKTIAELEQLATRDATATQGAQWVAQLTYARARRALVAGHQLESALLYAEAVQHFDACGDKHHGCLHRVGAGFSFNISGAYDRAAPLLSEAITMAEEQGKPHVAANARSNLGVSLGRLGRFDEAMRLEHEAYEHFARVGDAYYRDACSLYAGFVLASAERWQDVDGKLMPLVKESVAPDIRLCAAAVLSKSDLAQRRVDAALTHAKLAMALLDQLGDVEEGEESARLAYVNAAMATGDERSAATALRAARARILGKTTNCADAALREAFLSRVADNAEILRLAKASTR